MPITWDYLIAKRAKMLAQLRHGDRDRGAGRAFEQAERVARSVETDRQRGIVWVRHLVDDEGVRRAVLRVLDFDGWVLNAADTLVVRPWESLLEYADRIAMGMDTDVLAVAIVAIEDDMREGIDEQRGSPAEYESARRVLKGAAAQQQRGDPPATGGVAGDRLLARVLRDAFRALVGSITGAGTAMRLMMRGPGNEPLAVRGRLSKDDTDQLFVALHSLLQVMMALVLDVTGQEDENLDEDRVTRVESETNPVHGMETMALTLAHRLREFRERHSGNEPENGKVH